jgi:hypothetical protein
MRTVKSLLLGSAVGFVTVSVGQAADLPVKAKPVEYVKVCSLYGEGFWYIPGTDTCMKIGGFVRAQFMYNAGNGGAPIGQGSFSDVYSGLNTRTDTSRFNNLYVGVISVDVRTPTEYGTLRSYMDLGTQTVQTDRFGGNFSGLSVLGTPGAINSPTFAGADNYFNEATFVTRAFIQFAGITAGRMRSFFDINSLGPYDFSGNRIQPDTAGSGINGIAYTAQLGNGISASVSLEDPGQLIYGRGEYIINTNFSVPGLAQGGFGNVQGDNQIVFWDPVASLRIDQAWGFAQISGALHNDSGGYYGTAIYGNLAGTSGTAAGGPGEKWGWATSAGFTLNNCLGFRGDTAGLQGSLCQGAAGYCNMSQLSSLLVGGGKIAWTNGFDGTYNPVTNGGQISLATQWSFTAFWEHYWDPKWRTSFFGGIAGYDYTAANVASICPTAQGGAPGANGGTWLQVAWLPGSTCNPNYDTWQVGSRTMWNPHPYLDIGVEIVYTQLDQKNTGSIIANTLGTAGPAGSPGALSPTLLNWANQGVWAGFFRIQRNFLY